MIIRMSWSDAGNNYYNDGNTPIQTQIHQIVELP